MGPFNMLLRHRLGIEHLRPAAIISLPSMAAVFGAGLVQCAGFI
jgi:hypothetical protein